MEHTDPRPIHDPDLDPRQGKAHAPRLKLLGTFALSCRGTPLSLPAPARRLLALIALSPTQPDRAQAADLLWPELPARRPRGNLRNALWRLRSACPALIDPGTERLSLGPAVRVDVRDLSRLVQGLDSCTDANNALLDIPATDLLAELLPGWQDDWLTVEREHLHGLALHALERLSLLRAAAGRSVEALEAAYLAVRADPLRESAVGALIRVHLSQGNRIEALRAYASFRDRVREELGVPVEPTAELRRYLVEGFRVADDADVDGLPLKRVSRREWRKAP